MKKILYSLDEVVLLPAAVSHVSHRKECQCLTSDKKLPLFLAPMSCIVDEKNYSRFKEFGFNVIIPRTVPIEARLSFITQGEWVALGLEEAEKYLLSETLSSSGKIKICIDIANGHQKRSFDLCRKLKKAYSNIVLMVGNIAHPDAYLEYAKAGADYVRLGIGSGHVCTTSVQTGIHYPIASLISECREYKNSYRLETKIVADGGFGYIDQIVKALALGADYVMIGRIAASFPEACGEVQLYSDGGPARRCREYYGMSTEKAQKLMHPEPDYVPKHTEGTVRWIPVIDSTQKWVDDFTHALRSSMSYCSAFTLEDYCGRVEWAIQSPVTFKAYIKS